MCRATRIGGGDDQREGADSGGLDRPAARRVGADHISGRLQRAGCGDRPALCHRQNTADRRCGGAGHGAEHDHPQTAADLRTSAAHGSKAADDKRVIQDIVTVQKAPGRSDSCRGLVLLYEQENEKCRNKYNDCRQPNPETFDWLLSG